MEKLQANSYRTTWKLINKGILTSEDEECAEMQKVLPSVLILIL